MKPKNSFKNDSFRKTRGGHSRWLSLFCEKCKKEFGTYQKDGPGILKRLYNDRLQLTNKISGKQLSCEHCKTVLGIQIVYEKEKRPAYRLFAGAVGKKIIKAV